MARVPTARACTLPGPDDFRLAEPAGAYQSACKSRAGARWTDPKVHLRHREKGTNGHCRLVSLESCGSDLEDEMQNDNSDGPRVVPSGVNVGRKH